MANTRQRFARFMPFRILGAQAGRDFLTELLPLITPGEWGPGNRPEMTTNIAITFPGFCALELPGECLATFPAEFQEGMRARAKSLGDTNGSAPDQWDAPWNGERVHFLVMVYGVNAATRLQRCNQITSIVQGINGAGKTAIASLPHQDAQSLMIDGTLTRKEHFGFVDGISNPDVEGVPDNGQRDDIGNPDDNGKFRKIPAGEFVLGHPGEGGEVAPMPLPRLLGRNGSYLVVRKLEQHVEKFREFIARESAGLHKVPAGTDPEHFLAAKMMGRWQDGSPLIGHPDAPKGHKLPGGQPEPHALAPDEPTDRRGIMFLAYNSGFDQFEFVQQTWINFGDDFQQGNDMDPITGSSDEGRMMIQGDESKGRRPFLCSGIPRFVTTKGGDYFFVPSLTGLRLMASGRVIVS
jgi:deferrochelatase/peroxidase EfeB